ncbi:SusC/RagA family TonB-linked outer membrane protein [Paraflavitalea sp. CAU 1676]|uniref:SusC/RagA family TonB-linked outer membrane protein n=1 Tax=Paraflavitalea sp. CAU 1676 TaxID=3032598 RepID=UPI0023DA682B|nr:SusC/RagA family TonB-linked outer membrane protein [Paraflavitalea sp. CAU 1676]MDF2193527.1 SusC/RagA family TonB-linked outer membrane protein [Paraflavitalea sp. CAU 1676]
MKTTALLFLTLLLQYVSFAQDITVTGSVRSAGDNALLSGVSISVAGTNRGTTTNNEGQYSLSVTKEAVLVFSFLGYTSQQVPLNGRTTIHVQLQRNTGSELGEVVVTTALGIKKQQKTLGYSVQEVSGETMAKTKTTTALSALTGKVAGLNINNTTDLFRNPGISLRGRTPLVVIDGIPDPDADPYKINADDIESISVLKGTAAAALYGAVGVNGAIMYTTKKGNKGKLNVEFNSSTMFQTGYTVIPEVQTVYGGGDQGKYAYVNGSGGGTEGGGWIWGPKLDQPDPSTPSGFYETTQFDSPIDPTTGKLIKTPWVSKGRDNIKNFFRTGLLSTNSVSASIGTEKGSFRVAANHIFQKGVVPNTGLNNSSFSIGGNYKLSPKLTMDGKLTFNKEYSDNYPTVGYGPPNYLYNLILWIGPDVDIRGLENYWLTGREGLQQRNYNLSWYNNPHFVANELLNGYKRTNNFGQVTFDYKIADNFSVKFRNGFNQYASNADVKEPYSYIAYSYISRGNFSTDVANYFDINSDLILNYNHQFGKALKVNVTAGGSNTYRRFESVYTTTDGLTIPGFYSLSNSVNPLKASNVLRERRTASAYGMLDLETLGFLYLSFTGRYDKTSTLPTRNNGYFYPSAGVSAVLSDVLKMPAPISFLKVRGSWAKVNTGFIDGGNPYAHITTYGIGPKWNNTPSLSWPTTFISPDLVPETVQSGEYGIVAGFFKNRLNVDVTYFRNKDYNNFTNVTQSQASGNTSILKNANVYLRKGWEFMVSGSPIKTRDFKWEATVNFSNVHRWLEDATDNPDGYLGLIKEGQRTDRIYMTESRTPDGQAIYNSNGMQAYEPYGQYFGNRDADWIYGIQNTFSYKDFSLSFSFDGRLGGWIYSTTNQKMWWGGSAKGTVTQYRDDANAGKNTYVGPGVVITDGKVTYDSYGNIVSDTRKFAPNTTAVNYISFMQTTSGAMLNNYHYYSGSYLKMRELVFTYNLPGQWIKKVFSSASVSLIGNNLFILSKIPNVDPDAESDNLQTPSMRSMGFNLNLKF